MDCGMGEALSREEVDELTRVALDCLDGNVQELDSFAKLEHIFSPKQLEQLIGLTPGTIARWRNS